MLIDGLWADFALCILSQLVPSALCGCFLLSKKELRAPQALGRSELRESSACGPVLGAELHPAQTPRVTGSWMVLGLHFTEVFSLALTLFHIENYL